MSHTGKRFIAVSLFHLVNCRRCITIFSRQIKYVAKILWSGKRPPVLVITEAADLRKYSTCTNFNIYYKENADNIYKQNYSPQEKLRLQLTGSVNTNISVKKYERRKFYLT